MSFADELRNNSSSYNPNQEINNKMNNIVNNKVKDCIQGIKSLCSSESKKGKSSISGYLSVSRGEYASSPTAEVHEGNFKPFKDVMGDWSYSPPYHFDYGINGSVFDTSNEDRLKMALLIKDGILKGLRDCGFSHLSVEVITKPHYERRSNFWGKMVYSKTVNEIHSIYISISWK